MVQNTTDALEAILRDYPDQAPFVRKIRELMVQIQDEFDGEIREQLEQVLTETLERQATILENSDRSREALARYGELLNDLVARLHALVASMAPRGKQTLH